MKEKISPGRVAMIGLPVDYRRDRSDQARPELVEMLEERHRPAAADAFTVVIAAGVVVLPAESRVTCQPRFAADADTGLQ